ncbi:hypothetical protein QOT74_16760 [Pseudomonas aeruginosa]
MSSTQHQLIEQCATRLRGIVEALDNIHDNTPHRWSTDLDDVHSSAESLLSLIKDQAPPSEDQLIAAGLSYPLAKEDAVQLWYAGFRSEVVTVLEAWEAIGHDIGMNPSKGELLDSLRNMAAICNAHGNDMPAQSAIDQRQVIADAITGALAFGAQASQPPAEDHWLRPFYDIGRAEGQRTQELAMLVRMLASSLKRHAPESNLVARATNYLAAKGLAGTPFRDAPASVEQAGGDERAACNLWIAEQQLCQGSDISLFKLERNGALVSLHELLRDAYQAGQARAALAQPSPKCATCNDSGQIVVSGPHYQGEFQPPEYETEPCDMCAQPSPAQAEQAEVERPEVVARVDGTDEDWFIQPEDETELHNEGLLFAGCELGRMIDFDRIVGELRADRDSWAEQAEQRLADWDEMRKERDAALARVAEVEAKLADLEKQEPFYYFADCDDTDHSGLHNTLGDALTQVADHGGSVVELYRKPPAQAQHSAPEVSGIGRDTGHPRAVVLYLRKEPTDDDLRAIHDALRSLAAAPGNSVPQAWLDVQAERRRQITAEGWTPEHDDLYCAAELPRAAAAYILNGANDEAPAIWPFSAKWWKPRDARANYVRAAALILAEIERLDRAGISQSPQPGATTASS